MMDKKLKAFDAIVQAIGDAAENEMAEVNEWRLVVAEIIELMRSQEFDSALARAEKLHQELLTAEDNFSVSAADAEQELDERRKA
jgi:hypothetical protein